MIRRLLTSIAIAAVLGGSLAIPASAHSPQKSMAAAPKAQAGARAIKSYDCSLLPGQRCSVAAEPPRARTRTSASATHGRGITTPSARRRSGAPAATSDRGFSWLPEATSIGLSRASRTGVCFKIKWGRSWASGVKGYIYY